MFRFPDVRISHEVNCVDAMQPTQQAETLSRYYDEEDSLYNMLTSIVENDGSPQKEGRMQDLVAALQQAFASDLTRAGAQKLSREGAYYELGRQLYCIAHQYAKEKIDQYIDDNYSDLVWETNRCDHDN